MAAPLRAVARRLALPALLALAVAIPIGWAAASAVGAALHAQAWRDLWDHPAWLRALAMTLWTGLAATVLSAALAAWVLSRSFPGEPGRSPWQRTVQALPPMLAVPHAAFAIGLAFLLAPSGWLLRLLSPWATGFNAPPPWATTQDPWGLGLIAALVAKEVPFLLWAAATQLQRADTGTRWARELQAARSMGYSARRAWWRVLWPQLWPRLAAPGVAVLAYSLTVVDMALVIGPQAPPTLAVLAWQWLLDADPAVNAQGAAAAWLLAAAVAALAGAAWALRHAVHLRTRRTNGARGRPGQPGGGGAVGAYLPVALAALYGAVMLALAVSSAAGAWPFPQAWPGQWSGQAWASVAASAATVWTTLGLALASSLAALAWAVAWLECAPPTWDARLRQLVYLPLLLPSVLWVVGVHQLTLAWRIDAHAAGLWLAHTLAAAPYVLIALSPAYLGFDARYAQVAATLRRGRLAFLLRVKWPLLRASLWAALAVGFAVSVAQYLPTLFVGAGRFNTVTTEAVTLASGAQRQLTAAYAWLQWALPALAFAAAALAGRPRRFAVKGAP